ncbi:MAG: T9SS type A sorting domain-containing protein, partial [Bacteroidia bacterium]|nr:T9SS type A sorting domain-containing protein [Bacteroidia bacterium]
SLNNWHTFFQTDTTNSNDGECFIRPNSGSNPGAIGTATTGYTPTGILTNKWYRLVIAVNLGSYYRYYLNGQLILDGNNQDTDDRFAMNPMMLLFADNNQEDDTIDIASVAIFDTCLSHLEVADLGTVDPCILHPMSLNLGNDTSLCGSNSLLINLNKGYKYTWSTGDTGAMVLFNSNKLGLGTRTISVKMEDINNCVLLDTFQLSLFNNPSVNLGKDTSFCKGPSYRLVAGSASGNSFEWKHWPSGVIVSKINSMTTDSSGLYTVRLTNSNGCSAIDSVVITFYPIPTKPIITYNALELCQGDSFNVSGPKGFYKYLWNDGHTEESFKFNTEIGLRLRVQSAFGCTSSFSDSLYFKILPLPNAPIILSNPDTNFCSGDSVLLYINGNYKDINWNDGYTKSARQVYTNGVFKLNIRDFNNCPSDWSNSINTHVLNRPNTPELISPNGLDFCQGDTAELYCNTNADSILWSTGANTTSIKAKSSGQYAVKTQNYNGCSSLEMDTIEIIIHSLPSKPEIEIILDSLKSRYPAKAYQWRKDSTVLSDTTRSISFNTIRFYGLRVKNDFCWSEWSDTLVYRTWDIDKLEHPLFTLYPNPSNQILNILIDNPIDYNIVQIQIISLDGKTILSQSGSNGSIDISHLENGHYIINIQIDGIVYRQSFIKS